MRISLFILFCWCTLVLAQEKAGTIRVAKETVSGLYIYKANSGSNTYLRIFKDSSVMIANNSEDAEYMFYWFDRMSRDSNLPKGKAYIRDSIFQVRIKVAQSIEDDILLDGIFIETDKLKVHRVGRNVDSKYYVFTKVN
ncbi:MAG: hypothetical protein R2799_11360 [Crocinitomicaceae bacterium]